MKKALSFMSVFLILTLYLLCFGLLKFPSHAQDSRVKESNSKVENTGSLSEYKPKSDTLELESILINVAGKDIEVADGYDLNVKRGDVLRIKGAKVQGIAKSNIRINFKGFVCNQQFNDSNDIDCDIETENLLNRYSLDGKGNVFEIVALHGEEVIGKVNIELKERVPDRAKGENNNEIIDYFKDRLNALENKFKSTPAEVKQEKLKKIEPAQKYKERLDAIEERAIKFEEQLKEAIEAQRLARYYGPPVKKEPLLIPPGPLPDNIIPYITKGFEFHGYLRSGYGLNSEGDEQKSFKAPGSQSNYRLGNEEETYAEVILVKNWLKEEESGPDFHTQVRLALCNPNDWSFKDFDFYVREAFAQAGNVFKSHSDIKFWAGQRYYRRHDIYMNDFYYLDMSGYGGGVEDIDVGLGKLALAYIGSSDSIDDDNSIRIDSHYSYNPEAEAERIAKQNIDIRWYDIPLFKGKGTFWFNLARIKGGSTMDEEIMNEDGTISYRHYDYPDSNGFALGFLHILPDILGDEYNKCSFQYGYGAASTLHSHELLDFEKQYDDAWIFRITDHITMQLTDKFSMQSAFVYQKTDSGADSDSKVTWISSGIRPLYHFTEHFGIEFDCGWDYVNSEPGDFSGSLLKATACARITPGPKFWSRPSIRLYTTYAHWSDDLSWRDDFKAGVGGVLYKNDTSGLAFGIQVESWW